MENQTAKQGPVPEWWPPPRDRLAERLRRHQENQRIASRKRLPKECEEWLKEARGKKIIPGKKRASEQLTPWSFFPAYERLLSLGGTLDADGKPGAADGVAVWFGSREGILTRQESKRLAELEQYPRGWLSPRLLAVTRPEHEQLKRDSPKLLEGVEVREISEDEEAERLRLKRKLDEARVTEICFIPDLDTGKMTAMLCGPVPDDLLRKECSRAGRNLWHESPGGPPASGKPAKEVIAVQCARDVVARLKQNAVEQRPEETGKRLIALVDSVEHQGDLSVASNVAKRIERNQSAIQHATGGAVGKIYRCASTEAVRVLHECLRLANRLQRPPTRRELSSAANWSGAIKEFTALLREIGLAWLQEDHAAREKRAGQIKNVVRHNLWWEAGRN